MDVIFPFTLPFQHLSRRLRREKLWTDTLRLTFLISLWYSLNSWTSGCLRTCYQNDDILIRFGYIECIFKALTWRWGNSGRWARWPSCLCIISQLILNTLTWELRQPTEAGCPFCWICRAWDRVINPPSRELLMFQLLQPESKVCFLPWMRMPQNYLDVLGGSGHLWPHPGPVTSARVCFRICKSRRDLSTKIWS